MIKNECKIVRDVLTNYIEGLTSKETNEFIEKHTNSCKECKDILYMLKGCKEEEEQKEERSEEEEIEYLKKYNKEMQMLKLIASVLVIFILTTFPIVLTKKIKEAKHNEEIKTKGKVVQEIILEADRKLEELGTENNVEEIVYEKNNGNIKTETVHKCKGEKASVKTTYYGEDGKAEPKTNINYILISEYDVTRLEPATTEYEETVWRTFNNTTDKKWDIEIIGGLTFKNIVEYSKMELREEKFNGKDCYVVRDGYEPFYSELWIEKETNLILKTVYKIADGITEKEHSWSIGTVKDEDIFYGQTKEEIENRIANAPRIHYIHQ